MAVAFVQEQRSEKSLEALNKVSLPDTGLDTASNEADDHSSYRTTAI